MNSTPLCALRVLFIYQNVHMYIECTLAEEASECIRNFITFHISQHSEAHLPYPQFSF